MTIVKYGSAAIGGILIAITETGYGLLWRLSALLAGVVMCGLVGGFTICWTVLREHPEVVRHYILGDF